MNTTVTIAALLPILLLFRRGRFSHTAEFVDLISTFWHEVSHAVTASLLYGEVDSIRLKPGKTVRHIEGKQSYVYAVSASGVTNYRTTSRGFRRFIILGAGYAGPTVLSLFMALTWKMFGLNIFGISWSILLALMLLVSRGFTAIAINIVSFLFVAVSIAPESFGQYIPFLDTLRVALPSMLISALLLYGFKDAYANHKSMTAIARGRQPATGDSDTERMARMSRLPATFFSFFYCVQSIFGLIVVPFLLFWKDLQ